MSRFVTEGKLRRMILKASEDSPMTWARDNGITPQSVSSFLNKKQGAGRVIPKKFGLVPIVIFVDKTDELAHGPYRTKSKKKPRKTRGK